MTSKHIKYIHRWKERQIIYPMVPIILVYLVLTKSCSLICYTCISKSTKTFAKPFSVSVHQIAACKRIWFLSCLRFVLFSFEKLVFQVYSYNIRSLLLIFSLLFKNSYLCQFSWVQHLNVTFFYTFFKLYTISSFIILEYCSIFYHFISIRLTLIHS